MRMACLWPTASSSVRGQLLFAGAKGAILFVTNSTPCWTHDEISTCLLLITHLKRFLLESNFFFLKSGTIQKIFN